MSLMSPVCCCNTTPILPPLTGAYVLKHIQPHKHKQTGWGNVSLVYPSMKSTHSQHSSTLLGPETEHLFKSTALTQGFAVKLPQAMAVGRGLKACKQQTTMSRLTRVHDSVIQPSLQPCSHKPQSCARKQ